VKISFVIVTYKADKELKECIKSIKTKLPHEIIVIDNGLPHADVGFGTAVNKGVKKAKGEYLFILNPDVKFFANTIDNLYDYLVMHPDVGIVGPNLKDSNGKTYEFVGTGKLTPLTAIFGLSFINKIFPWNPISKYYWKKSSGKYKQSLVPGTKEVDVAPGAAFLISKKLFNDIGGFDENFFLYFEESDLCKRVREKGYKIVLINSIYAIHIWGTGTAQTKHIDKYFGESRKYYFEKHYGKVASLVVEFFTNFGKYDAIFVGIIFIAIFLRFFRINENLVFHGELGQNYLAIKDAYFFHQIPLLGPPTSHPWLSFGPLFYYIFGPFLILNRWNPNTGPYFFGVVGILGIIANYLLIKKYFSEKIALISSYIMAISTTWIDLSRQARFFSMVTYLFYPFLFLLLKTLRDKKYLFWLGLIFGVMLNFHLAPIFLISPVLILFWQGRNKIKFTINDLAKGFVGFIIPNIPFLIYNLKTGLVMLTRFAVWLPYRSVIYHNFNFGFTLSEIINFFGGWLIFPVIFAIYLERRNNVVQILISFLFFGILALVLHKDPPEHYFYVMYAIPIILFSIFLSKISNFLIISILIMATVMSFTYLFSDKWFYINQDKIVQDVNVPYKLQVETTKKIISSASGQPFNLYRVGFGDQFENNYEQNYSYLLWYFGNQPRSYPTGLSYTIIEYPDMKFIKTQK